VRHRLGTPSIGRQTGLCPVKHLNPALLVTTKHQGVLGRVKAESDDILALPLEVQVVRYLGRADQVRREPSASPLSDLCTPW